MKKYFCFLSGRIEGHLNASNVDFVIYRHSCNAMRFIQLVPKVLILVFYFDHVCIG